MGTISYDPTTPQALRKELDRIVRLSEKRAHLRLPDIIVTMNCSYATSPRNFAAIAPGNPTHLHLCPDFSLQRKQRIRGVLAHEVGHILQWLTRDQRPKIIPQDAQLDSEQEADYLVGVFLDIPIYYDENLVQQAGRGARGSWPRPRGLH